MKKYWPILQTCPLFAGLTEADLSELATCFSFGERQYEKNDVIFLAGEKIHSFGIVLSGSLHVIQDSYWGDRTILTYVGAGELFAEAFVAADAGQIPVSVLATQPSTILLIDFRRILRTCAKSCSHHEQIIRNMMHILAEKNVQLTRKMSYLTQGTTAKRILAYLSVRARESGSNRFDIPFNRQELADYLSVDRSALSRELSKMRNDGYLDYHRNTFELKK